MASTAPQRESLFEESLRQADTKRALKTALACCLATGLSYSFHLRSGQFAPLFAFLLMTLGMPSPRLTALLTQIAIAISALVSAFLLITFRDALFLYLAVTLLWVFACLLFANWFRLPASLGSMVSALGIFVFFSGTVGSTLAFYVDYAENFLFGGLSVAAVNTLIWPGTTEKVFLQRLAQVYAHLEEQCRQVARQIRSGASPPLDTSAEEWAPFRPLRQLLAPELRRGQDTSSLFARMILTCRALNLRLWFFNHTVAPALPADLPAEARRQLANILDQCAGRLRALLEAVLHRDQVVLPDADLLQTMTGGVMSGELSEYAGHHLPIITHALPLAAGVPQSVLHRVMQDLQAVTTSHNALFSDVRKGLARELATLGPLASGTPLIDTNSLRASTKLVLLLLLLLVEEEVLGFWGGSQVAFFAVFFASTGNLGRQNKTDLFGLAGILAGVVFGIVAAFFTSRLPQFPLLLAFVFLGEFLAYLAYQKLPRFGVAGLQAGLALPFAYLSTSGPEWGSFAGVRTRFAGLFVAGLTAVIVHAYLWPVLPMRRLRLLIAGALRDTGAALGRLFTAPSATWEGAPPSLREAVTQARDLLDDARYLPGPDHADPAYNGVLTCLHEIDANLEYVRFLLALEEQHALRQLFISVVGDYAAEAQSNLERVAQQFQESRLRAACVERVRWQPDTSGRWQSASHSTGLTPERDIDPWRPLVIARCLDQIARAVTRVSGIACEVNQHLHQDRASYQ